MLPPTQPITFSSQPQNHRLMSIPPPLSVLSPEKERPAACQTTATFDSKMDLHLLSSIWYYFRAEKIITPLTTSWFVVRSFSAFGIITTLEADLPYTFFTCKGFQFVFGILFVQGKKTFHGVFCNALWKKGTLHLLKLSLADKRRYAFFVSGRRKLLQNMDMPLFHANQITPAFKKKWTVVVQVVERRNAKKKENGPLYRNYVVTDTQGTKVPIVVFYGNVAHFANTLLPFKRYYVSNASVRETPAPYKVLEYLYTWTLYRKNLVEPYDEPVPPPLPCTFRFDSFSDFYRYADQERSICIRAFIIQALPVQEGGTSSTRDFIVLNEEMIPMLMRTWDDLLVDTDVNIYARYKTPTLIIAYGLKVTTLNDIATLVQSGAYLDPARLFHPPRPSEILPLNFALASIENAKTVWTEGKLTYLSGQRKVWFEACAKCLTPLDVDIDWKIKCSVCQEFTRVCVRMQNFTDCSSEVAVTLRHEQTAIEATIKSPEIDKLLPFTGTQLKLAAEKEEPLTKEIEEVVKDKHVICFMKYFDRESRGIMLRHYPLVKIYTRAEVEAYDAEQQAGVGTEIPSDNPLPLEHIGSSTSTPQAAGAEKEFFTPTTKTILEEVCANKSVGQLQPEQTSGAKRMLPFGADNSADSTGPASGEIQPGLSPDHCNDLAPIHVSDDPLQTTPSKKAKAKQT